MTYAGGDARQVAGDADGPPPLRRPARRHPAVGLGLHDTGGTAIQLLPSRPRSSRARSTSSPTRPRIRSSSGSASPPSATSPTSCATRPRTRSGTANPLAGDAQQIYTFCYSQPCRAMHDFVRLGFNQTAAGGRAVDGIESLVAGASGGFFNYRFAQPGRTMRQHIGRWYPERQFPFANQVTTDPVTGQTDGVLRRCSRQRHLPEDLRDQLRDRVLEQGRLAVDHRHPGQRPRPRRDAERALLPPVEPPARARDRHRDRANSRRTRCCPIPSLARSSSRSTSGSPTAPRRRQPGAARARRHARARAATVGRRLPRDPRRHLQRTHHHR